MGSIYVLLPVTPVAATSEFEYLVSTDGRSVGSHASAVAALLPAPTGAGSEIVAIAPAAALSWHQVELPKGTGPRSPRLRAVLEGLLEDRLLDEADQVHFALQPRPPESGAVWVAACDRAWLRGALQVLEAAGRPATRVVPEFAPEGDPVLYALGEPEAASLVCAGSSGVFVTPLSATAASLLPALPENTPVIAEPAIAAMAEQVLQHTPRLQQPSERLLAAAQGGWDLAQLEFASTGRARAFKKLSSGWGDALHSARWRPARWGAAALVLVQLIGLNAWAWKERNALAAKRDAGVSIIRQAFPQVRAIVDPPAQMEREVAVLRQGAGGASARDLETMLGVIATAAPGRTATSIEYAGGELRLRGLAAGEPESRPLLQALRSQGFSGTLQGDVLVVRPEAQP